MTHVTIAEDTPRRVYTVDSTPSAGPFEIPFGFFALTDIQVFVDGTEIDYAASPADETEFSVSGTAVDGGYSSGTFTLGDTVADVTVIVQRSTPYARTEDFPYPSPTVDIKVLNTGLDRIAAWAQQLYTKLSRTVALADGDPTDGLVLPIASERAGMFLAFDDDGNPIPAAGTSADLGPVTPFIDTLLDDADVATAQATLELVPGTDVLAPDGSGSALTGILKQGLMTIWVPAVAMYSRTTNGAAAGAAESTTNKVMSKSLDFDTTTQEFAQFAVMFPKNWNLGTVTFAPVWTAASGSGTVVFGLQGVALSNDDALDTAFGTVQTSSDTLITANDVHVGPTSAAITIAGTPAVADWVAFQINRTVASDTLGVDARLLGVRIFFTVNAADDT